MPQSNGTTRTSRQYKTPNPRGPVGCLGPLADLESHLPDEWWRDLFDDIYLKTDGDVVENAAATHAEIERLLSATEVGPGQAILDLCCGQGRHSLELARRGFRHVTGVDRSRYLIRVARHRAEQEKLAVRFREGDARTLRVQEMSQDLVMILGNSFGYFATEDDDLKVLRRALRALAPGGRIYLDIADGDYLRKHFEKRSWEWVDQSHFVCRERSLSGDGTRLISREVVVHDERGVIADQFYAERLYDLSRLADLLEDAGFREIRFHGSLQTESDRNQDLGMLAQRDIVTAMAPRRPRISKTSKASVDVLVLLGDPRLPDPVKRNGCFNTEDHETVSRLKNALSELSGYRFAFHDNHATLDETLRSVRCDLVLNLCDEGFNNDAFQEGYIPARLEALGLPYTGAGMSCLAICYNKTLVRALAASLDVPVPAETYLSAADQAATLPGIFPAILKPNFGDCSIGISADSVVHDSAALLRRIDGLRQELGPRPILVQEFLQGTEYTVGLIGNPDAELQALPILQLDYSGLGDGLPEILGYESKFVPESPWWTRIRYREAELAQADQRMLIGCAMRLFERLGCRDYARFDFRADSSGTIKLLEANPNPGWCWDGKMNIAAELAGMRYAEFLQRILESARVRLGIEGSSRGARTTAAAGGVGMSANPIHAQASP